jgi:hypothetical protein
VLMVSIQPKERKDCQAADDADLCKSIYTDPV